MLVRGQRRDAWRRVMVDAGVRGGRLRADRGPGPTLDGRPRLLGASSRRALARPASFDVLRALAPLPAPEDLTDPRRKSVTRFADAWGRGRANEVAVMTSASRRD